MDKNSSYAYRAEKCNADLFSPFFPGAQLKIINAQGERISDFVNAKYLEEFFYKHSTAPGQNLDALMLVAQTGKGKNYWVIHTLRQFALKKQLKIICLFNRVALSNQQIKEVSEVVDPTKAWRATSVDDEYNTGNITLMTYHKFYSLLKRKGAGYFKEYDFCVVDESHFFCQDCLFNADTERILKSIPNVFRGKFRIYMTATPDYIYDLIYWAEWNAIKAGNMQPSKCSAQVVIGKGVVEDKQKTLPILPVIRFEYDYSAYQNLYFFEKKETLLKAILDTASKEKWIVFVNNKELGKALEEVLCEKGIESLYIDRDSRSSLNIEERFKWEYLQEKGNLGKSRVLISTSVLDNGFSIKDKEVKNIVLFAEDKIEFLQELGRVRLEARQKVKIYISKMSAKRRIHPNTRKCILDVFAVYYGSSYIDEFYYPSAEIKADRIRAMDMTNEFGFVGRERVEVKGETLLKPYINNLARYVVRLIQKEAEEYQRLVLENQDEARILYKQRWLRGGKAVEVVDMEKTTGVRAAERVEALLSGYENILFDEGSDQLMNFAKELQNLFKKLLPKDKSINTGRNRPKWTHIAINNHLETLSKEWDEVPLYRLEKIETGEYKLMRNDN